MRPKNSLLLPDIDLLRKRLSGGGDIAWLGEMFRHIVAHKLSSSDELMPFYAMLWPSATDDWTQWLDALGKSPAMAKTELLMMDSWISSAIAMRMALYAAWAADAGKLSRQTHRSVEEQVVKALQQYIWPMFRGRAVDYPPVGRSIELCNQTAGMLVGLLFAGHVFGYRLGRNKLAREIYQRARDAYPLVIGALDQEGYQGEGPTYQMAIESTALILSAELLDAAEGGDHYHQVYAHPCEPQRKTSLARFIEAGVTSLYLPTGLHLSLDDFGPGRAPTALPLVYAAHRSGERRYMDMLAQRGPLGQGMFLWWSDELAFRIMYWPRKLKGARYRWPGSYVLSKHFGILDDGRDSRVLQLWDRSEPMPQTHAHINPNSITVEAFGVQVMFEGRERSEQVLYSVEPGMREIPSHVEPFGDVYRFGPGDYRAATSFAIGAHNCVLVDKQDVLRPRWDAAGKLVRFVDGPVASVLSSDTAAVYEALGVPLLAATRHTLVDKRRNFFVVGDDLAARVPHTYTWQAHLRGNCEDVKGGIVTRTREGVGLEIVSADGLPFERQHLPSFPAVFEGESTRLRRDAQGRCAQFTHLIRPLRVRTVLTDITNGWQATLGELIGLPQGMSDSRVEERWQASMAEPAFLKKPKSIGRWVTYRKSVRLAGELRGARIFLHLPLPAGHSVDLNVYAIWINGEAFDTAPSAESHFSMLDSVVEITRAVKFGDLNQLLVQVLSSPGGGTQGRAFLTAELPGVSYVPSRVSRGRWGMKISADGAVSVCNPFGPPCAGTDAVCGLIGTDSSKTGYGALFDCTYAQLHGIPISGNIRFSIQWDRQTVWLMLPNKKCRIQVGGKTLLEGRKQCVRKVKGRKVQVLWQ